MHFVYILQCSDGSFYVGSTNDVQARLEAHTRGQASSHTRTRLPVQLLRSEEHATEVAAVRRERQLKGWTRPKKQALIEGNLAELNRLSRSTQSR